MGLFGESAMTKRFKCLAFAIMAANGAKDAGENARRLMKDLER